MIKEKKGKYPFIIITQMTAVKKAHIGGGVYWILNQKMNCFLYSFSLQGLKDFIIQDDKRTIDKILVGIDKMDRSNQKITLCKIKFNLGACKKLSKNEISSLSDTARDFFYFIQAFRMRLNLKSFVNIWMVEDKIQDLNSSTCGIFQLHFYENLFNPDKNSRIQNDSKLKKVLWKCY